jgi:hypothetical protein
MKSEDKWSYCMEDFDGWADYDNGGDPNDWWWFFGPFGGVILLVVLLELFN